MSLYRRHILAALILLPLLTIAAAFDHTQVRHTEHEARTRAAEVIARQRARIEDYVSARIQIVRSLAAFVRSHPDLSDEEFDILGKEMIAGLSGVRAIQLARDGVITAVVPREGNEEALGLDLMADSERRMPVETAITTRSLIIAGPQPLRQGGEGLIARTPIFVTTPDGERLWGLAIVVLDMPTLLHETDTASTVDDLHLALRNGVGGAPILGDPALFEREAARAPVTFAATTWELAAQPVDGWPSAWPGRPLLAVSVLILAIVLIAMAWRIDHQTHRLQVSAAEARRNEQRFRMLFDQTLQLTGTVAPDGTLTAANHTACEIIGKTADDVIGRPFWTCPWWSHDAALAERVRAAITHAVEHGEVVRFECCHSRAAGGILDIDFSAKPLFDDKGRVRELLVEGRDITDRKRTQRLLETRLRLVALAATHNLHDLLVATLDEVTALTGAETGFYHFLLPDQSTLSLQAWSTRTTREYCTAAKDPGHYAVTEAGIWAEAIRQGRSVVYNDYASATGRKGLPQGHAPVRRFMSIPIFRDGTIVAIIGVGNKPTDFDDNDLMAVETLADLAWDLTDRKRADEALVERNAVVQRRYESLRALNEIAALPPGSPGDPLNRALELGARHLGLPFGIIAQVEGETYTVLQCSAPPDAGLCTGQIFALGDTFCALTLQADDVVAIPHVGTSDHAAHPCYRKFGLEAYIAVPIQVNGHRFGTVNFSSPTPTPRDFDEGDYEFMRLLGRWVGSMLERRQAEEDLVAAKEKAEYQAKELARSNGDLEQFAYVASHDLRQPLRMVNSYLALLERRLGDTLDADNREFIGFARDGALQMDHLILDLLEYSRVGRHGTPPECCTLAQLAAEAVGHLSLLADDCGASFEIAATPAAVTGNHSELVRLFQNLIGNGLKYRNADRAPAIVVTWRREGADWLISVADNGIGIAPEYHAEIFKIFRRLHGHGTYEGTGIGLAICQKIVTSHGGRIWVESQPGEGCRFLFTLPATSIPDEG